MRTSTLASRATPGRRRVLIVRSCRQAEFVRALAMLKAAHPGAEVWALTHPGHTVALHAAGVDRVIETRGRRFDAFRVDRATVMALRSARLSAVAIPQMTASLDAHANLYRCALLLGAREILIVPPDGIAQSLRPVQLCRVLAHMPLARTSAALARAATAAGRGAARVAQSCRRWLSRGDRPLFVCLAIAARFVPRRRVRSARGQLHVLHIISTMGLGGAQVQLASLLNRTPQGYHVDVLVLCEPDGDFSRRFIERERVHIDYLPQWPGLTASVLAIARRCRQQRYDVVHTWLFSANAVGVVGARLAGVRRVVASVRAMSGTRDGWPSYGPFARLSDVLVSRAADAITVNATALVGNYARWALLPVARLTVVHNGIEPAMCGFDRQVARHRLQQQLRIPAQAKMIGSVGRLSREKDQATFLRIVAAVAAAGECVCAVVVGDGPEREPLERLAADLGLADAVRFAGRRPDARHLLAGLDALVLTSTSEGFPNVLLEAMVCGVPCISTDVGGSAEVLGPGARLFHAGDVANGARAVLACLGDAGQAQATAADAQRRATELFTVDRSVAKWLTLYGVEPVC